jgi:hypothetical protein
MKYDEGRIVLILEGGDNPNAMEAKRTYNEKNNEHRNYRIQRRETTTRKWKLQMQFFKRVMLYSTGLSPTKIHGHHLPPMRAM